MRQRLRALVLARPRLDGVELRGIAVEHVCVDYGDEADKSGRQSGAQRKHSAEGGPGVYSGLCQVSRQHLRMYWG